MKFFVLLVLLVLSLGLGLRVIASTQGAVVERLGRFHRLLGPGLHWFVPGIDRLRGVPQLGCWGVIECRETTLSFHFVDASQWQVSGHFWFCIDDLAAAAYAPQPLLDQMQHLARGQLQATWCQVQPEQRMTLQWVAQWQNRLDPIWARWGVRLVRITIEDCAQKPA